jgi:ribose transport system substrate-binding protein
VNQLREEEGKMFTNRKLVNVALGFAIFVLYSVAPLLAQTASAQAVMAHTSTGKIVPQGVSDPPVQKPTPKNKYVIGISLPDVKDPFFLAMLYGAYKEAERMGLKIVLLESGGYANVDRQISQMEDLIEKKVNGILVDPADDKALVPVVEKAVGAGIPVIGYGTPISTPKISSWGGSSHKGIGIAIGNWLVENVKEGTIVAEPGPPGAFWSTQRYEGFKEAIAKDTKLKIIGEKWTDSDRNAGLTTTEDFLQRFPDLNIIYTGSDFQGAGACDAIKAVGKAGKIINVTAVLSTDAERYLREGVLTMTEAQQTVLIGTTDMDLLVHVLNGETVPKGVEIPTISVTKPNVDQVNIENIRSPDQWRPY